MLIFHEGVRNIDDFLKGVLSIHAGNNGIQLNQILESKVKKEIYK